MENILGYKNNAFPDVLGHSHKKDQNTYSCRSQIGAQSLEIQSVISYVSLQQIKPPFLHH